MPRRARRHRPEILTDGASVAFVVRWGSNAALSLVPVGRPERLVSTEPQPSPGRGLGGGCFDRMRDEHGFRDPAHKRLEYERIGDSPLGVVTGT